MHIVQALQLQIHFMNDSKEASNSIEMININKNQGSAALSVQVYKYGYFI